MAMTLTSPAFKQNGQIPSKYTCEGDDISPPLAWEGVPEGTKSLVLIVDDPDAPDPKAPQRVWVHWVVYNIPADTKGVPENAGKAGLPKGVTLGLNDFTKTAYGGPCPPIGRHRYFHKLYESTITRIFCPRTASQSRPRSQEMPGPRVAWPTPKTKSEESATRLCRCKATHQLGAKCKSIHPF